MATTLLARQPSPVRCAICARPARRGATLCAQCKAAVKRARQVPNVHAEFLPHPSAATDGSALEFGETRAFPGSRINHPAARPVPGGWGTYATLIAFGAAVCLTGYLALGELGDAMYPQRALRSTQPAPSALPGEVAARSRPPLPSLAVDDPGRAESAQPADAPDAQPSSALPGRPDNRSTRKPAQESQPLPGFDPTYAIAEPIAPEPAGEAVAAIGPPVVESPEPVVPDRWQLLASATTRCERENILVGLLCKERARLQYCEGHWGAAPQCSGSVAGANSR